MVSANWRASCYRLSAQKLLPQIAFMVNAAPSGPLQLLLRGNTRTHPPLFLGPIKKGIVGFCNQFVEADAVPLGNPLRKPGFSGSNFADVDNLATVDHELVVSCLHNGLNSSWREQPPASFARGSY